MAMTKEQQTQQRRSALAAANAKRQASAEFRRELAAMTMGEGLYVAADLIERGDENLNHMRLRQVVGAVHWCGQWHARSICLAAGANVDSRLRDLTEKRRAKLATVMRDNAIKYEIYKEKQLARGSSDS